MTQQRDGPGRVAEREKWVRFTRLGNLCAIYSMTRQKNGTQPAGRTMCYADDQGEASLECMADLVRLLPPEEIVTLPAHFAAELDKDAKELQGLPVVGSAVLLHDRPDRNGDQGQTKHPGKIAGSSRGVGSSICTSMPRLCSSREMSSAC